MKTTDKHFKIFQKECQKWIDIFELNNWHVRYEHKKLEGREAQMDKNISSYNTTICLNLEIQYGSFKETNTLSEYLKKLAKHEVLHILLGRLSYAGESRDYTTRDMQAAEEELVIKLIKIIKE
jgi:hypothetical protein